MDRLEVRPALVPQAEYGDPHDEPPYKRYEDLATGFATYVEARRHRAENVESRALRAFQIYGAAFAIVSTCAAVMQVLGEDYVDTPKEQIGYPLMLFLVAVVVIVGVTFLTRRRESRA